MVGPPSDTELWPPQNKKLTTGYNVEKKVKVKADIYMM